MSRSGKAAFIALGISLTVNVFQARHIWVAEVQGKGDESALPVGRPLAMIDGLDPSGGRVSVRLAGAPKPTVLYVFRPGCIWCERNAPALASLAEQLSGKYQLVGISLQKDGLAGFLGVHPVPILTLSEPPTGFTAAINASVTPETLVVSPDGRFVKAWDGAYFGDTKSSIEKYFSVALPNLGSQNELGANLR